MINYIRTKKEYIALTKYAMEYYDLETLKYIDNNCFVEKYSINNVTLYQSLCKIEEK